MSTHIKNLLILVGWFACIASYSQQPLTYQVLTAAHTTLRNQVVSQFDNLLPGDTVHVEKSGYLALISNYFHSIEIGQDSILVLPDLGTQAVGEAYVRPDLQKLFSDKNFSESGALGSVEQATPYMKLLYPTTVHTLSSALEQSFPVIWHNYNAEDEKQLPSQVTIKSIFEDDIVKFSVVGDSFCLNMSDYPEVLTILQENSIVLVSLSQEGEYGGRFAIKLPSTGDWHHPFDSDTCKIDNATRAVAFAMFLEYSRGAFKGDIDPYYQLATQLSSRAVYKTIYEQFMRR